LARAKRVAKKTVARLDERLVLNTSMNRLFGMKNFKGFQDLLKEKDVDEGFDEEGRSFVFNALCSQNGIDPQVKSKLEEYDSNIKSYVDHIIAKQEIPIRLKYFQYLSVLFTEIFLDRYFGDKVALENDLNKSVETLMKQSHDYISPFSDDDLRKLAFWMATGSGKTLLLHINYLQFLRYNRGPHHIKLDNILLIPPTESLSNQHIAELQKSNIPCELFQSQSIGYFSQFADPNIVKVIDIHKLTDKKKGQGVTVDIESFGNKNLVFVDEGHKGSSGERWRYFRDDIASEGFTFEYSATFGQAVAAATKGTANDLLHKYGKSIIFDYSYRYFYEDGYGKEYSIFNLRNVKEFSEPTKQMLMLANLLTLYEQKHILDDFKATEDSATMIAPYKIEDPLWVFVGSKVQNTKNQSDILEVVRFLDRVLSDKNWAVENISKIFRGTSGLEDENGNDLFSPTYPEQRLSYLRGNGFQPDGVYEDLLQRIFQSERSAHLHLINIKDAAGEIALRCGSDGKFFGVIDIGDDKKFLKYVDGEEPDIHIDEDEISGSLFNSINQKNSDVNVLIGAKKFIEGWNSLRVSNIGLLNIGKSEGTQIIQLFGRGVRLHGKHNSLKRSKAMPNESPPANLPTLEKLNIFGIEANYMEQFREYLKTEGLSTENTVDLPIPIKIKEDYLKERLLVPCVDESRFKKEQLFELRFDKQINPVEIDLVPRIERIESQVQEGISAQSGSTPRIIDHKYIESLDWSHIYFTLLEFKTQKEWSNMIFSKEVLREIVKKDSGAYILRCPYEYIHPNTFENFQRLEGIVISILKKYLQKSYNRCKNRWTKKNMDVMELNDSHGDFEFKTFRITVNQKETDIVEAINSLKKDGEKLEKLYHGETNGFVENVYFDKHIYQPLLAKHDENSPKYEISPVGLNDGEKQFMRDLKDYVDNNGSKFTDRKMFVLRNRPKKGIGFFVETVNFYPDFVIWIKTEDKQHIIFADPKGLVRVEKGFDDEKIQLHRHIKDIEKHLANKLLDKGENQEISLNSFIISVTPKKDIRSTFKSNELSTYEERNVLFQEDKECIQKLLRCALDD
jgi:hypothetical protein